MLRFLKCFSAVPQYPNDYLCLFCTCSHTYIICFATFWQMVEMTIKNPLEVPIALVSSVQSGTSQLTFLFIKVHLTADLTLAGCLIFIAKVKNVHTSVLS